MIGHCTLKYEINESDSFPLSSTQPLQQSDQ